MRHSVSSVIRPSRGSSSYTPKSTRPDVPYKPSPFLVRLAWLSLPLIGAITLTVLYVLERPPTFSKSKYVSVTIKEIISVSSRVRHVCAKRSRTGTRAQQPDDIVTQLYPSSRRCTQYKQGTKEYDVVVMVEIPGVDGLKEVSRPLKEYPKIGDAFMEHVHNDKIVPSLVAKPVWPIIVASILYIIVFFRGWDLVRDLIYYRSHE